MKSIVKGFSALVLLLVLMISMAVPALAWTAEPNVAIKANDDFWLTPGSSDIDVERGETLDFEFYIESAEDLENFELTVKLVYEYGDETTMDSTGLFDLTADRERKKTASLTIPNDYKEGDARLFVVLQDEENISTNTFDVHVSGARHDLTLERVLMTPNNVVKAGSYLTVKARVENLGSREESDILFSAEVEGLEGAYDSELLDDEFQANDAENTQELYLAIPLCAKAGEYKVKTALSYNKNDEVVEYNTIRVVESESSVCAVKTDVTPNAVTQVVVPEAVQTVKAGESLVLPVTITNAGSEAKNYVVSLTAGDLGSVRFVPSNTVTVAGGSTETVYVYVDTNANVAGQKVLGLTVKAGNEYVKESTLTVNVEGEKSVNFNKFGLRKALEIGLVVLIVLIVLVGLIVGFNKLKDDDDDFEEEDKSYY